jgi:aryl-alcohol dehydrogenase-like predicted oxidoreductase
LTEVANKRELPASQIALAWMLRNPAIGAPIVGATKIHHLDDVIAALSIELSSAESTSSASTSAGLTSCPERRW